MTGDSPLGAVPRNDSVGDPNSDSHPTTHVSRQGDNAAKLQYVLGESGGISAMTSFYNRLRSPDGAPGARERDGYWNFKLTTPRLAGLSAIALDYSVGGFDGDTGDHFGDLEHHKLSIKARGETGRIHHGIDYRITGAEYNDVDKTKRTRADEKDKEKLRLWLGRSFGDWSITPFVTRSQSNIYDNPGKPVVKDALVGANIDYTWSRWPYVNLSVSHSAGIRESSSESSNQGAFQTGIQSLGSSLNIYRDLWGANLSVSRTTPDDSAEPAHSQPISTSYYLGGSIYPDKALTLTPSVSFNRDEYRDLEVDTQTLSATLSVAYAPESKNYQFTADFSYDSAKNRDWGMDTNYYYAEAGIRWQLKESGWSRSFLTLSASHDRYEDGIYSASGSEDFSVRLEFKSLSLYDILLGPGRMRH
jgi:hypothetical protein